MVYRFDTGGLENGVVNLVNCMSAFQHAVVSVTEIAPAIAAPFQRDDVCLRALAKPPGQAFQISLRLVALPRAWRPAIVHSRNLAALECQPAAAWAGVPVRIHGERKRDVDDLQWLSRKLQWIRCLYATFVYRQVALLRTVADYLTGSVGPPPEWAAQVYNCVGVERFRPTGAQRAEIPGSRFADTDLFVVGTVVRMFTVKVQPVLARAFERALDLAPGKAPSPEVGYGAR